MRDWDGPFVRSGWSGAVISVVVNVHNVIIG